MFTGIGGLQGLMMNERIQKFAEQAGLRFTQLMINPMVPVVDGKETDLEKFAELIIQECCEVAHCNSHVGGLRLCNIMKEHFGLEE